MEDNQKEDDREKGTLEDDQEDDSDSSSSDKVHALLLNEVQLVKDKVASNPYGYDDHVNLTKLYRQAGDLDGARKARHDMSAIFPLTESLWLEWIKDELPLASAVIPDSIKYIKSLFERAVDDYLSVQIWIEYCSFTLEMMSELGGVDHVREIFEKAITCVGLHTAEGSMCWSMYRDFEKTVLQSFQEMQAHEDSDIELKEQVESQYERIDKLFKRHLAVPVLGINEVFEEYRLFNDSIVVTEDNLPSYTRAVTRLNKLLPYEEELLSMDHSLDAYKKYIQGLTEVKEEHTLINVVYQRALADHPLQAELWLEYLSFLNKEFSGVGPVLLKGHRQAVRNCPWQQPLWMSYVIVQQKMGQPHEEIIATFDQSLGDLYRDSSSYLKLWIAYCDYMRRRAADGGEGEINDLRKLFRRAREHLDTYFSSDGDPTDSLSQYQASLEARCYGNMEETRLLWTDIMKRHGRETKYWTKYAQLERVYGEIALCRKVLLLGVNSASDDPDSMCEELLQFEREEGTLDTFQYAMDRCTAQLARVKERKEKAAEKELLKKEDRKQQRKERRKAKGSEKQRNVTSQNVSSSNKRKRQAHQTFVFYDNEDDNKGTVKKPKLEEQVPSTVGADSNSKLEEQVSSMDSNTKIQEQVSSTPATDLSTKLEGEVSSTQGMDSDPKPKHSNPKPKDSNSKPKDSNPRPPKKNRQEGGWKRKPYTKHPPKEYKPSVGGKKRISLVPRAVQIKGSGVTDSGSDQVEVSGGKTNDDFRKMFLKK